MSDSWYCTRNGQRLGPFTFAQLRQMAAAALLVPADPVWNEGASCWVSAGDVPGLVCGDRPARAQAAIPTEAMSGGPHKGRDSLAVCVWLFACALCQLLLTILLMRVAGVVGFWFGLGASLLMLPCWLLLAPRSMTHPSSDPPKGRPSWEVVVLGLWAISVTWLFHLDLVIARFST